MSHCSAFGCTNNRKKNKDLSFHRFPLKNKTLLNAWFNNANRDFIPSKNSVLCGAHFTPDSFIPSASNYKQLREGTIPTIFNLPDHVQKVRSKKIPINVTKKRDTRKLYLLTTVKKAVRVTNKQLSNAPSLTLTTQKKKNNVNVEYRDSQYHKCEICNIFLPKRLSLVLHGARHLLDADRTYAACCLTCNNFPFYDEEKFQSHLTKEHDNEIECEHCGLSFETMSDYVLHLKELIKRQKEICSHCGQAFNHARFLKRHNEIYHKKARWVCYRCWVCYERCFSKFNSLLDHLKVIHKLSRSQLDMRLVKAHKYSNLIKSPLKQPFANLKSMEDILDRWACKICGSFFASKIALNGHVCPKAINISGDILSAKTNSFHNISNNSESHFLNDQESSIRCQVCNSVFATEEKLKRHGRLHGTAFLRAHRNP